MGQLDPNDPLLKLASAIPWIDGWVIDTSTSESYFSQTIETSDSILKKQLQDPFSGTTN
ncbi:MAG: hypothetical protein ABTQ25_20000 [Nitrosomonas ureae]